MRRISGGLFTVFILFLLFLTACQQDLIITLPPEEATATPEEAPPEEAAPEAEPTEDVAEVVEASLADLLEAGTAMKWYDNGYLVFVPEGEVVLGDNQVENNLEYSVSLDDYWIYMFPVTNAQYNECVATGTCSPPATEDPYPDISDPALRDDPVVGVTWDQAGAYCQWMKGRLPTKAEWEKAARGPQSYTYPWGEEDPTCDLLNFQECEKLDVTRVFEYPEGRSYYQAFDLAGNTFEWVFDLYQDDIVSQLPGEEPYSPPNGTERTVRSSSYVSEVETLPSAELYYLEPDQYRTDLGFRCVIGEAEPEGFASPCVQAAYVPGDPPPWHPPGPQHNDQQIDFQPGDCRLKIGTTHTEYCTTDRGGLDLYITAAGADDVYLKSWSSPEAVACVEAADHWGCFGPELAPVTFEVCATCTPPLQVEQAQLYCDCGYTLSPGNPPTCIYNGAPPQQGQTCPCGFIYDPVDDICKKIVMQTGECQSGYEYDQSSQCCVATFAPPTTDPGSPSSTYLLCPPGYSYAALVSEYVFQGSGICVYLVSGPQQEECITVTYNLGRCPVVKKECKNPGQYTSQGQAACVAAGCKWVNPFVRAPYCTYP